MTDDDWYVIKEKNNSHKSLQMLVNPYPFPGAYTIIGYFFVDALSFVQEVQERVHFHENYFQNKKKEFYIVKNYFSFQSLTTASEL